MATAGDFASDLTFNTLIDDCLRYVFNQLSLKEKVAVARVCRRWQRLVGQVISWTEVGLDFTFSDGVAPTESHPLHSTNIVRMNCSLFDCFKFESIKKVSISNLGWDTSDEMALRPTHLKWLFDNLPRLDSLRLDHVSVQFECDIECLTTVAAKLKKLFISNLIGLWQDFLSHLFDNNDSILESLHLEFFDEYETWIPQKQISSLNSLRIENITLAELDLVLWKNPQLKSISGNQIKLVDSDIDITFLMQFQDFRNLQELQLSFDTYPLLRYESIGVKLQLPNLRKVSLSEFVCDSHVIKSLLKMVPSLQELSFTYFKVYCICQESNNHNDESRLCPDCPKEVVRKLALLPKLRKLEIGNDTDVNRDYYYEALLELLVANKLPLLRVLKYWFDGLTSPNLFAAFCKLACKSPKQSFAITRPTTSPQVEKPRNLFFI